MLCFERDKHNLQHVNKNGQLYKYTMDTSHSHVEKDPNA